MAREPHAAVPTLEEIREGDPHLRLRLTGGEVERELLAVKLELSLDNPYVDAVVVKDCLPNLHCLFFLCTETHLPMVHFLHRRLPPHTAFRVRCCPIVELTCRNNSEVLTTVTINDDVIASAEWTAARKFGAPPMFELDGDPRRL